MITYPPTVKTPSLVDLRCGRVRNVGLMLEVNQGKTTGWLAVLFDQGFWVAEMSLHFCSLRWVMRGSRGPIEDEEKEMRDVFDALEPGMRRMKERWILEEIHKKYFEKRKKGSESKWGEKSERGRCEVW